MADGLAELGVELHVATTNDNAAGLLDVKVPCHYASRGVQWHYFARQCRTYTTSLGLTQWVQKSLIEFDVAHIHAVFSWASTSSAWLAKRKGVPYLIRPLGILNRWGMTHRRPLLKKVAFQLTERPILEGARAIHYTALQEQLEAEELGFKAPAVIIPNPVEFPQSIPSAGSLRAEFPQLQGKFVAVFLSRISEKKGLDLLIPAIARARRNHPSLELVIAGEGATGLVEGLKKLAVEHGVEDCVHWTGFVEGDRKWASLADADLFVLPSYSENFGVAVVEAMGVGLPVLVTDQVGLANDVAEHDAGWVTKCDIEELAQALSEAASQPILARQRGQNGQSLARRQYSVGAVCRRIIHLYEDILNAPGVARRK
jgi:glycosyltransferase involved in cell wall biosynthesis